MTRWKIHYHGKKSKDNYDVVSSDQKEVYDLVNLIGTKQSLVFDYVEEIEE